MDISIEQIYTNLPEGVQPLAQKWFYRLNPNRSWEARRKPDETDDAFVTEFFEDEAEFERYQTEFFEGPVPDIVVGTEEQLPDEYTIYDAHRDECLKYYSLVRKYEPDVLVETGVYNGVSTLSMLAALHENGHGRLHSIDHSEQIRDDIHDDSADASRHRRRYSRERPSCAEPNGYILPPHREAGWIVPERFRDHWSLTRGRSQRELPKLLPELGGVDLFLHDSERTAACMSFEFELAWEWLTPGGMAFSSHVDWNDVFETFIEERPCHHGLVSYHYLGYHEEPIPCSTAYIRKPAAREQ